MAARDGHPGEEHMENRYQRLLSAAIVLLAAAVGLATPALAQFTFFVIPSADPMAETGPITVGPDGALWFTECLPEYMMDCSVSKIGRITTAGVITEFSLTAGSQPAYITPGSDGNLYVTEHALGNLARVNTAGNVEQEYHFPTAGCPLGASEGQDAKQGPDGWVWVTLPCCNSIGRVRLDGTIEEVAFNIPTAGAQPFGITAGPDDAMWFTEYNANKIGRVTTDQNKQGAWAFTEFPLPTPNSKPTDITLGPDGALWFTEEGGNGKIGIGRITTDGVITEFPIFGYITTRPPDGALWITNWYAIDDGSYKSTAAAIGRMTTAGVITNEFPIPPRVNAYTEGATGVGADRITTGPDGALWFTAYTPGQTTVQIGRLVPSATRDFNGDGYSDIAWRDTGGNNAIWLMNGSSILSSAGLGAIATAWSIVGQRDFNGDGNADLLWHDSSGDIAIWFMNGTTVSSGVGLGTVDPAWSIVGTGDFNGDGKADILWRDTSGNIAIWLMNGSTILSGAGLGKLSTAWSIIGTGDFNGDGKTDILWRDTSGNLAIWFMNGTTVTRSVGLGTIAPPWTIVATGDFNGDGISDILWRNTATGDIAMWLMSGDWTGNGGVMVLGTAGLGSIATAWSVAETGDFNGDGKSDILWRDSSGDAAIWFMNGTTVSSGVGLGTIATSWTIQGAGAD
jgi:streptogramin lyase